MDIFVFLIIIIALLFLAVFLKQHKHSKYLAQYDQETINLINKRSSLEQDIEKIKQKDGARGNELTLQKLEQELDKVKKEIETKYKQTETKRNIKSLLGIFHGSEDIDLIIRQKRISISFYRILGVILPLTACVIASFPLLILIAGSQDEKILKYILEVTKNQHELIFVLLFPATILMIIGSIMMRHSFRVAEELHSYYEERRNTEIIAKLLSASEFAVSEVEADKVVYETFLLIREKIMNTEFASFKLGLNNENKQDDANSESGVLAINLIKELKELINSIYSGK